jgi:hypothetical protein
VNGEFSIDEGQLTHQKLGQTLRRTDCQK